MYITTIMININLLIYYCDIAKSFARCPAVP